MSYVVPTATELNGREDGIRHTWEQGAAVLVDRTGGIHHMSARGKPVECSVFLKSGSNPTEDNMYKDEHTKLEECMCNVQ